MAGNITGKEATITVKCTRCPAGYTEVWGFQSLLLLCPECFTKATERFWELYEDGKVPIAEAFRVLTSWTPDADVP